MCTAHIHLSMASSWTHPPVRVGPRDHYPGTGMLSVLLPTARKSSRRRSGSFQAPLRIVERQKPVAQENLVPTRDRTHGRSSVAHRQSVYARPERPTRITPLPEDPVPLRAPDSRPGHWTNFPALVNSWDEAPDYPRSPALKTMPVPMPSPPSAPRIPRLPTPDLEPIGSSLFFCDCVGKLPTAQRRGEGGSKMDSQRTSPLGLDLWPPTEYRPPIAQNDDAVSWAVHCTPS